MLKECGEIMDLNRADWRKSSYSGNNGGACVEVARNLPLVAVATPQTRTTAQRWSSPAPTGVPALLKD